MKLELERDEFSSIVWAPIVFLALVTICFGLYSCNEAFDKKLEKKIEVPK